MYGHLFDTMVDVCVSIFRPTTTIALLGCGTSERNGLARNDVKNLAQAFPLPCHQSVTHVRGAKGDCFGGATGAKTKTFTSHLCTHSHAGQCFSPG
eukprot:COSAG02_NODE_883_length_16194_cov_11.902765_1_plen_96_part_00